MAINALNPNSVQQFRPNAGGGRGPAGIPGGPQQGQQGFGPRGDQAGISREAQQAAGSQGARQGGGAQQLTQALAQGIGQVMQAQQSGDENQSKQALDGLKQTYDSGAKSGQLEQVPGPVRQTAESLLGIDKQKEGGGGGKCGGGGQPKEGGEAQDKKGEGCQKGDDKKFDEETLKKLEELLGKDKCDKCKKDKGCDKKGDRDEKDKKCDSKAGEHKTSDTVADSKPGKVDATSKPSKTSKPAKTAAAKPAAAKPAPRPSGGGSKKAA